MRQFVWKADQTQSRYGILEKGKTYNFDQFPAGVPDLWISTGHAELLAPVKKPKKGEEE